MSATCDVASMKRAKCASETRLARQMDVMPQDDARYRSYLLFHLLRQMDVMPQDDASYRPLTCSDNCTSCHKVTQDTGHSPAQTIVRHATR